MLVIQFLNPGLQVYSWTTALGWPWRFVGKWGGACIHVHVNLPGVKCGSSSEEFHLRRPQVVSRRLQHCRYPDVGPVLEVFERFLTSSHGFEVQRAWAFHFARVRATICVHVVLAMNLEESKS